MSGDPEQEYFADGMVEDLITALSRVKSFFVIARNSCFTYKGKAVDIKQVGRELGVRYVLEGSVRKVGGRVRITGQLIEAATGYHVWADRFDGNLEEVFDLQDRITEHVVAAIEPNLQFAEIERLRRRTTTNLNAYDHLLHAQQLEYQFTDDSLTAAIRHCKQAVDIDPIYAPAMALAAYCYGERRFQGWTRDIPGETREGLQFTEQALEHGKFDPNVLWMCALAAWQLGLDTKRAQELAYRSLETNPNSAIACTIAGWIEAYSGHYSTGKELLGRAQRLSPRDPRAWFTASGMAIAHLGEGRFEEGAAWARKALAQNPRYTVAMRLLAANLANLGNIEAASDAVAQFLRIEPDLTIAKLRARLVFMNPDLWNNLTHGLRLGGLIE
jgi:TolB-like protein